MSVTTLVPLRSPGIGKTRLAAGLDREERAALSGAMLADVISALRGAGLDDIVILASGAEAAAAGGALGVDVLIDDVARPGLNAAIDAASLTVANRCQRLLVVVADLACVTSDDVEAVLASGSDVAVAPTTDGGTGALLRSPPGAIRAAYGPASADRHLAAARTAGLRAERMDLAGFRTDVDTLADLARLADAPVGSATRALLVRTGIERRTG